MEENDWKNDMVLWTLPQAVRAAMPRIVRAWFRCYVMCTGVCVPLLTAGMPETLLWLPSLRTGA